MQGTSTLVSAFPDSEVFCFFAVDSLCFDATASTKACLSSVGKFPLHDLIHCELNFLSKCGFARMGAPLNMK